MNFERQLKKNQIKYFDDNKKSDHFQFFDLFISLLKNDKKKKT